MARPAPIADAKAALAALLHRAHELAEAGRAGQAIAALDAAPPRLRGATWHLARGSLLLRGGDLAGAEAAFRAAVALEPTIGEMRANLGAALLARAKRMRSRAALDEAIEVLEAAARLRPKTAIIHNNLGAALEAAGRGEEALAVFDAALAIAPRDATARRNRDALAARLGKPSR
jgi:tetratricopeptide (TPR) repeat protein